MKQTNPISITLFFLILSAGGAASLLTGQFRENAIPWWILFSFVPAFYFLFALKIANQWEKAIVLRFGKFSRVSGPGLFFIVPLVESVPAGVDQRVMVTPFAAQKTLTKDTVPVDVDAVLFWVVWDAQKAALEVENYRAAVDWAAQTALCDIIGRMTGTIGSAQPNMNGTKLASLRVQAKADAIRAAQAATQKELDALMPSVLAKAFCGELQTRRVSRSGPFGF